MAHLALETNAIYIFFSHSWGFLSTVLTVKIYCKVTHALLFVYFLLADKSLAAIYLKRYILDFSVVLKL